MEKRPSTKPRRDACARHLDPQRSWQRRCKRVYQSIVMLSSALCLNACGGGGNGGNANQIRTTAHVQMPAGSSMAMNGLLAAATNSSPVDSSGQFTFDGNSQGGSLVVISDSNNLPLMAAMTQPASRADFVINARSTALALLFYASGAFTMPQSEHVNMVGLIEAHPAFNTLATAVETRLAANPHAITDKDAELLAAVQTAKDAMAGTRKASLTELGKPDSRAVSAIVEIQNRQSSRAASKSRADGDTISLLLAQPSEPQSGIIVGQSDDMTGLQITNTRRRHLLYYIKQIGWEDEGGGKHDFNGPVTEGSFPDDWLPSTNKLSGAIGSVVDVIVGNGAYQPVSTKAIPLPVQPTQAEKAIYQVTVVGPGASHPFDPKLGVEPFKTGASEMLAFCVTKDIFLPLFFSALDIKVDVSKLLNQKPLFDSAKGLISILAASGHVGLGLTSFEAKEVTVSVFKAIADDFAFRQAIFNWLTDGVIEWSKQTGEFFPVFTAAEMVAKANFILSIIDKALTLGDAAVAAHDMADSYWFEEWEVQAIRPRVKINPNEIDVKNRDIQTLKAVSPVNGSLTYHWKCTGKYGHLVDARGHSGNDFTSTEDTVTYSGDVDPPEGPGDDEIVTVDVEKIPETGGTTQRIKIGSAESKLHRKLVLHFGEVTVNIKSAVDGDYERARFVTLGSKKFTMVSAEKGPSSLGTFVNTFFRAADTSTFAWHGHVETLASGTTVPAKRPNFVGSLDLRLPAVNNGVHFTTLWTAYLGTITITNVTGNRVDFTANATLEFDPEDHFIHDPPGSTASITVEVSGFTTMLEERRSPSRSAPGLQDTLSQRKPRQPVKKE